MSSTRVDATDREPAYLWLYWQQSCPASMKHSSAEAACLAYSCDRAKNNHSRTQLYGDKEKRYRVFQVILQSEDGTEIRVYELTNVQVLLGLCSCLLRQTLSPSVSACKKYRPY